MKIKKLREQVDLWIGYASQIPLPKPTSEISAKMIADIEKSWDDSLFNYILNLPSPSELDDQANTLLANAKKLATLKKQSDLPKIKEIIVELQKLLFETNY